MMGVIEDSLFEEHLKQVGINEKVKGEVIDIKRGRGNKSEIPAVIKKIISEEGLKGAGNKELAQAFGVSISSISAYKNDATSTASYDEPNQELKESNDKVRTEITEKAREKLISSINSITADKLNGAKVRDLASVAKDMSAVIKNMEPNRDMNEVGLRAQFIFHAPRQREESDFEVIDVRE